MSFDDELDLLAADTVAILGTRTVTLRKPTTGAINAATRTRETGAFTDYTVPAIKGDEPPHAVGGGGAGRAVTCLYTVNVAALTALSAQTPARGWRLVDDGVEWQVTEVSDDVDGRQVDLLCTRAF